MESTYMEKNKSEQVLQEVKKEDDIYFKGPFWIVADSLVDIRRNNFKIIGLKEPCYYDGTPTSKEFSRKDDTHKKVWEKLFANKYLGKAYNFYPRGRVGIYEANGVAYIFLNSQMNNPFVINAIIREYRLEKLNIEVELNDLSQGNHYDFQLK